MKANKMKGICLVLIIGFCVSFSFAQEKETQVIYFDSDWIRTSNKSKAIYSRVITFYENDLYHPVGLVKDYYLKSGNLQWEGEYSYYDINNEDNNKEQGLSTWYYENGAKSYQCQYNEKGEMYGLLKYWYENGKLLVTYEYNKGKIDGLISFYDIKGVLQSTIKYEDGVADGLAQDFNENPEDQKADSYSDEEINN
jgi:antitoxin component YwqK of YwqJK toxin-antitoxin module